MLDNYGEPAFAPIHSVQIVKLEPFWRSRLERHSPEKNVALSRLPGNTLTCTNPTVPTSKKNRAN
jgi:hypothetical protein